MARRVTGLFYGAAVANLSSTSDLARLMDAARAPGWSFTLARPGEVMATRDSGQIGLPWVVLAVTRATTTRVSLYRPGDDLDVEGEVIGELAGNPRERGRQLRTILGELELSE
jgi:hypothetical protein